VRRKEKKEVRNHGRGSRGISRREFARRAAVAAAGISAAPLGVFTGAVGSPAPAQQPPAEKLSAAGQAEAAAKTQYLLATYGARLTDAQQKDLRRLIKEGVAPLEELRKYALSNGIQPATVLRLYPEPQPKSKMPAKPGARGGR